MKKAYIILAHKNYDQLNRLIERLDDGSSHFFVHIDSASDLNGTEINNKKRVCVNMISRIKTNWGSYDLVQATLNALTKILEHPVNFERITLLSGQDYPIKSNIDIDAFYSMSEHRIFIDHFSLPNYKKWPAGGGLYRLTKYFWGFSLFDKYAAKTANFISGFFSIFKRRFHKKMKHYHGSQWWTIDDYSLKYLLNFVANNSDYVKFHRHTFAPDELFFQTILLNASDSRIRGSILNDNKVFMTWEHSSSAHPNTLTSRNFEAIESSTALFARKFDAEVDVEILEMIDSKLLCK